MIKVSSNLTKMCLTKISKDEAVGPDYGERFRRGATYGAIPGALLGGIAGSNDSQHPAASTILGALLGGTLGGGVTGLSNMADAYLNEDHYNEDEPNYEQRGTRGALIGGGLGALVGGLGGAAMPVRSSHPLNPFPVAATPDQMISNALIGALLGGGIGAAGGGLGNIAHGYMTADLNKKNKKSKE